MHFATLNVLCKHHDKALEDDEKQILLFILERVKLLFEFLNRIISHGRLGSRRSRSLLSCFGSLTNYIKLVY